jgi:hypothetical protein
LNLGLNSLRLVPTWSLFPSYRSPSKTSGNQFGQISRHPDSTRRFQPFSRKFCSFQWRYSRPKSEGLSSRRNISVWQFRLRRANSFDSFHISTASQGFSKPPGESNALDRIDYSNMPPGKGEFFLLMMLKNCVKNCLEALTSVISNLWRRWMVCDGGMTIIKWNNGKTRRSDRDWREPCSSRIRRYSMPLLRSSNWAREDDGQWQKCAAHRKKVWPICHTFADDLIHAFELCTMSRMRAGDCCNWSKIINGRAVAPQALYANMILIWRTLFSKWATVIARRSFSVRNSLMRHVHIDHGLVRTKDEFSKK